MSSDSWNYEPNRKGLNRPTTPGGNAIPENKKIYAENKSRMVSLYGESASRGLIHGPAFEAAPVEDEEYPDGYNTSVAIQTLDELVQQDKPWFFAAWLCTTTSSFQCPKKIFRPIRPRRDTTYRCQQSHLG